MIEFIIDLMVIIWLTILVYLFLSEVYFRSRRFKGIKRKIEVYTKECNELNDHIEGMKYVDLGFKTTYKSYLKYSGNRRTKGKKNHLHDLNKYGATTHICSRDVLRNAISNPMPSICRHFTVEVNETTLERLENILNDFSAVEEGNKEMK